MKKNDSLKKNHFWILFGLVPLFVLIAVLMVTSSVGAEIDKKAAEIKAAKDSVSGKNPKPEKLIEILNKGIEEVKKQKTSLWNKNWDMQAKLFTWPNSPQLKAYEKMNMKFGDKIPEGDDFAFAQFKLPEVYLAEYSNEDPLTRRPATKGMAMIVEPTEFRGGWQAVLRHVTRNGWGAGNPTSEQIWLLLEDIWVQRSLLDAVRSVNQQMAAFAPAKYVRDGIPVDDPAPNSSVKNPLRKRFESRTWAVELEVKTKDNKQVLTGRLINLTNRLQLMGLNNTMVLNVWLDRGKDTRPFEFRIGGEFLPGAGAMKADGTTPANVLEIVETPDHIIPATMNVVEIARVEQKFDTRTVPVRRIEALALGKTDSRHAGSQLVPPEFLKPKDGETAPPTSVDPMAGTGDAGSGMPPGGLPGGYPGSGTITPIAGMGGGRLESVIDANKNRYLAVTPQVRRMPVGIVVLVDQSLVQDVLLAFANTPLRFQVTQVTWKRFRGSLSGTNVGGTGSAGDGGVVDSGSGDLSSDLRGRQLGVADVAAPGSVSAPSGVGTGLPGGVGTGPPGRSPPGSGSNPYSPSYGGYNPYGSTGGLTTVSESQLTSGLVELGIYGVVSLYEKYSPEQEAADAEKKDKEAKEQEAKEKEAKDKAKETKDKETDPKKDTDPMPMEPMNSDPKAPKKRRRFVALA